MHLKAAWRALVLVIITASITGCLASKIHETDRFGTTRGVQTLAVDAKQRVVIFSKDENKRLTVTCAEPSPDALSALSTSVGGSIQDPKVAANFAIAQAESAASIGLRTQSIQLLRDGMYRLCEAYAAGALKPEEFNREQRRYQNLMLSLLAIEQLTGAVVARQAALGEGSSNATVGELANQAADEVAKTTTAVTGAQSALKKAQDTQTKDENACTAAGSDPANANCTKVATDKDDAAQKQTDLKAAQDKQRTAQDALLAARGAVRTAATGAKVSLPDPPKTNALSDASARSVAEATRTIVTTTLIASFAQEECARVWDQNPENIKATVSAYGAKSGGDASDVLRRLIENCRSAQDKLFERTALFTPDYGQPLPPPLNVVGAESPVPLPVGGSAIDLRIVGGTPEYEPVVPPSWKSELEATVPKPKGAIYMLHLSRPSSSSKVGSLNVTLLDANNKQVEVPILLTAKAAEKPSTPPKPATTKISSVTSVGSTITVKFTPAAGAEVKAFTATATNANNKEEAPLSKQADGNAKEIELTSCKDTEKYAIALETELKSGDKSTVKGPSVTCSAQAVKSKPPAAPTEVKATASAGLKIVVSFAAPKDNGGSDIQKYTAAATPVKAKPGVPQLTLPSADKAVAPITLTGCKVNESYVITVVANSAAGVSQPGKATDPVKCVQ